MIIIISGSKVVDIKEEEIVHCMGEKKRVFLAKHSLFYKNKRTMRRTILAMLTIAFGFLYSCTNTNSTESTHSFAGTFITENGVRFELRADSTTLITFSDSVKYEGTWKSCKAEDHLEYANIEFGGYQEYYYLKDEKLYRSEREMRHDALGTKVKYQE